MKILTGFSLKNNHSREPLGGPNFRLPKEATYSLKQVGSPQKTAQNWITKIFGVRGWITFHPTLLAQVRGHWFWLARNSLPNGLFRSDDAVTFTGRNCLWPLSLTELMFRDIIEGAWTIHESVFYKERKREAKNPVFTGPPNFQILFRYLSHTLVKHCRYFTEIETNRKNLPSELLLFNNWTVHSKCWRTCWAGINSDTISSNSRCWAFHS